GPDGVRVVPADRQLWAGDAHSLVKVVDLSSGAIVATVSTGASNRADELAYDPQDHLMLIANDADDPPFLSFISTTSGKVVGKIPYPNATNGLEQPVWDPANGMFYQSVPATKANPGGEIDKIDPKTMKVVAIYSDTDWQPAGLVSAPPDNRFPAAGATPLPEAAKAKGITLTRDNGSAAP